MALSCIISKIKESRYWSALVANCDFFFIRHLHSMPPLVGSPSECCHPVCYRKTRMVWSPDGENTLMICSAAFQQNTACDGHTSCHSTVRATHTRRAIKMLPLQSLHRTFNSFHSLWYLTSVSETDNTKSATRQSPNYILKKNKIKKIWRKTIFNMPDGILTPCNVARS